MSSSRESCRALAIARPRHLKRSTVLFPAAVTILPSLKSYQHKDDSSNKRQPCRR